jgi:hypothetical protein
MPNWCNNTVTVEGEHQLLQQFYDENQNSESLLSFAKAVPEKESTCESHYATWGTKWDACDVEAYLEQNLCYSFQTAWSPPEPWFYAIVKKYPQLRFTMEYCEPMMDFEGIMEGEDGETIESCWSFTEIRWDELLESGIVDRYMVENASNDIDDIIEYLDRHGFNDDYAYIMEGRIENLREEHIPIEAEAKA